jgi:hypothetical protein
VWEWVAVLLNWFLISIKMTRIRVDGTVLFWFLLVGSHPCCNSETFSLGMNTKNTSGTLCIFS